MPLAVSFTGITEWETAKVSFSSLRSPQQELVHQNLEALKCELIEEQGSIRAAITVRNAGSSAAIDVVVLAVGYDADGKLVAWGAGHRQWRTLSAGDTSAFETGAFLGDPTQVAMVRAYISAYKPPE